MSIVGIDPGLAGAVAVLDANGTLDALADTPTLVLKVQRGTRQVYDVPGMAALLRPYAGLHVHVIVEESQPIRPIGIGQLACGKIEAGLEGLRVGSPALGQRHFAQARRANRVDTCRPRCRRAASRACPPDS